MSKRPDGNSKAQLREKLAAVLRDLMVEVDGKLERAIPYDDAKKMTADQVISLFNFDHGIHNAIDGAHEHWNYTARLIPEHRKKTHAIDRPQIRKTDRISEKHNEFKARLLSKAGTSDVDTRETPVKQKRQARIPSRPFPKRVRLK